MIQDRPVCFDCETRIDYDPVFAPPWHDDLTYPSAAFHGICLMRWRERRAYVRRVVERHLKRECSCYDPDAEPLPELPPPATPPGDDWLSS